ncbi:MAG: hypothetical protein ABI907_06210, partial [Ramlibacter sp.]
EATAATESMKEQAAALLHMVSRFKFGENDKTPATPPAAAAVAVPAQPVRERAGAAALPPAPVAALPGTSDKAGIRNGQWEEF